MEENREDILSTLPVQSIVEMAKGAEARINAIKAIKNMALAVTNAHDWTNQQGRPYLQGSGAEKVAGLFNISWRIDEPRYDVEEDGHFTFTYRGSFSIAGRSIEVDGSRSSKDPFFKKYDWVDGEEGKKEKKEKPISAIDKRDVKMSAYTNCLANGITRLLGIRNLTWEDLKAFAGIDRDQVQGIEYKSKGEKPPLQEPQKKSNGQSPPSTENQTIITTIEDVHLTTGTFKEGSRKGQTWEMFRVTCGDKVSYTTFSKTIGDIATKERGSGLQMKLEWRQGKMGREIVALENAERIPGSEG